MHRSRARRVPQEPFRAASAAGIEHMTAPASQTQWYLAREGQQYGPLSDAELAKFIELGHLQPNDLLWREGFPDWRPAMVVFPQRAGRPTAARAAHASRARSGAAGRCRAPGARAVPIQGNPRAAPWPSSPAAPTASAEAEPDEARARGGALKKVCWSSSPGRCWVRPAGMPIRIATSSHGICQRPCRHRSPSASAWSTARAWRRLRLAASSGSAETIDARLQATPLWRLVKREFPDWYAERLKEIEALRAGTRTMPPSASTWRGRWWPAPPDRSTTRSRPSSQLKAVATPFSRTSCS